MEIVQVVDPTIIEAKSNQDLQIGPSHGKLGPENIKWIQFETTRIQLGHKLKQ